LPDADVPRDDQILSDDQVREVVRACWQLGPDLGLAVECLAQTGARDSQLRRLTVSDLLDADSAAPRINMATSAKGKKGKTRRINHYPVSITPSLAKALRHAAAKNPGALLLPHTTDTVAARSQFRCAVASVVGRDLTPYCLRHSSIVRQLQRGAPTSLVAANHDTSESMIRKNYAKFIGHHSDAITRRTLIDFGAPVTDGNVVRMSGRK
jgi:integrase